MAAARPPSARCPWKALARALHDDDVTTVTLLLPDLPLASPPFSALQVAVKYGAKNCFQLLLERAPNATDEPDSIGEDVWLKASSQGSVFYLQQLVAHGFVDRGQMLTFTGDSSLHLACSLVKHDRLEELPLVVKTLLEAGASSCAQNGRGELPLDSLVREAPRVCCHKGASGCRIWHECFSMLLQDMDARRTGSTPAGCATVDWWASICNLLEQLNGSMVGFALPTPSASQAAVELVKDISSKTGDDSISDSSHAPQNMTDCVSTALVNSLQKLIDVAEGSESIEPKPAFVEDMSDLTISFLVKCCKYPNSANLQRGLVDLYFALLHYGISPSDSSWQHISTLMKLNDCVCEQLLDGFMNVSVQGEINRLLFYLRTHGASNKRLFSQLNSVRPLFKLARQRIYDTIRDNNTHLYSKHLPIPKPLQKYLSDFSMY